jgi:hypothetical protein
MPPNIQIPASSPVANPMSLRGDGTSSRSSASPAPCSAPVNSVQVLVLEFRTCTSFPGPATRSRVGEVSPPQVQDIPVCGKGARGTRGTAQMLTSLQVSPEKDSQVRICNDSQPVTGPRRWTCSSHQLPVTQPSAVFGSVCTVQTAEKQKGQHHNWQPGPQSASRACLVRPLPQSRRRNVRGRHLPDHCRGIRFESVRFIE